jgi:hypothetical protein
MGIFDKAMKTAKSVGNNIGGTAVKVGSNVGSSVQDNSELAGIKMQINTIEQELQAAYSQIGKRYVDYIIETGDTGGIDVADLLKLMEPKMAQKQDLETKAIELEKKIKEKDALREKAAVEQEFQAEKEKLDKALAMDIISQEDYNEKLAIAKKKVDNFEVIRKLEQQCDMGIITKEELKAKIDAL